MRQKPWNGSAVPGLFCFSAATRSATRGATRSATTQQEHPGERYRRRIYGAKVQQLQQEKCALLQLLLHQNNYQKQSKSPVYQRF
jgi:hypothetical protein